MPEAVVNAGSEHQAHPNLSKNLQAGAEQLSIFLTSDQVNLLVDYLLMLHKWNRVYNLTAVRGIDEMVGRHILDSLSVLQWLPKRSVTSSGGHGATDVLDVGTGAGLPVLPLAICRPDLHFLSVESNGKKTRFQQQAVMELGLNNVSVVQERIENVFDKASVVVSRAFTAPENFLNAIQKNTLNDSQIIIMLGLKERMPDVLPSDFKLIDVQEVDVPQCDSNRHIALCAVQTGESG